MIAHVFEERRWGHDGVALKLERRQANSPSGQEQHIAERGLLGPRLIALLRRVIAPYPLPSPVIALALRMLQDDMLERQRQLLAEVARNKAALLEALADRAFLSEIIPGEANFVLARVGGGVNSGTDCAADPAVALLAFCAERGVILRGFPAEPLLRGYIRITVGTRDEIAALSVLLDAWEQRT